MDQSQVCKYNNSKIRGMNKMYYSNYNSIINEGQRIRRMRRTELSAEKIAGRNQKKNNTSSSKPFTSCKVKSCRSLPKVQRSCNYQRQNTSEGDKIVGVSHQYYMGGKTTLTQQKQDSSSPETRLYKKKENNDLAKIRLASVNKIIPSSDQLIESNQKKSSKISFTINKNSAKNSLFEHKFSEKQKIKNQRQNTQKIDDNYGLQENLKGQSYMPQPISYVSLSVDKSQKLKYKKSKFQKNSKIKLSKASYRKEDNYEMGVKIEKEEIIDDLSNHSSNQKKSLNQKSEVKLNSKTSFLSRNSKLESQKKKLNLEEESSIEESLSSRQKYFSKMEHHGDSILNIMSSRQKIQSWKEKTIKSLGCISMLNEKRDSTNKANDPPPTLDKRMQLKLESIRKQNKTIGQNSRDQTTSHHQKLRTSFRNLPLTSREPSHHRSLDKPISNSLESVYERIEIHQIIITLLIEFKEATLNFYADKVEQCEKLCYLLERKHILERNKMVKALKGGKNIFNLTSLEIPSEILCLYLEHPDIKNFAKQIEEFNKELFKSLEKSFRQLKKKYRDDPHIKLETPVDDFSSYIVQWLHEELKNLFQRLDSGNISEKNRQRYQERMIETMEKVFVLSQLAGRKVKKLQFTEEIQDFQKYYDDNFANLIATMEYFQQ